MGPLPRVFYVAVFRNDFALIKSGAPNEKIVQNRLNIALLNMF